jgi:4-amino-4-deoxy-L-arabinose transferase-like glycosyltransferase
MKKILFIAAVSGLLLIPFLGKVHLFDWDEVNFAEISREMILSNNYMQPQINYVPFYEKPPLFMWMQVLSMKVFGINEFAARFPNALFGIIVLCSLFIIGKRHFSERMGWFWVLSFGASLTPHFYFKTGLIDPVFNFFIFHSIYSFCYLFQWKENTTKQNMLQTFLSALFAAMAIMTKGPVAIILITGTLGLTWIFLKFKNMPSIGYTFLWIPMMIGFSGLWFAYETHLHGSKYINEFITYQIRLFQTEDAKHGGTILFHPIALLLGCFPASIFMWSAFKREIKQINTFNNIFFKAMLACFVVVLVVFSLVQTKIIHYSSMDYFPITFFSAIGLSYMTQEKTSFHKIQLTLLAIIGFIWSLAFIMMPIVGLYKETFIPFIHDPNFVHQLQTPIEWNAWASIFGVIFSGIFFYGFYLLTKKQNHKGVLSIFLACLICIETVLLYYVPRIEKMVQGALIEFCEEHQSEDTNQCALYMKSYAIYFYSDRKPFKNLEDTFRHLHYLYLPIQKDCYFFLRTIDTAKLDCSMGPKTYKMYNKNGFTFYKREK